MGILDGILNWFNRALGGEVIHDFGLIDTCSLGNRDYETRIKLRQDKGLWCLNLDLRDVTIVQDPYTHLVLLYFRNVDELLAPFRDARRRIDTKAPPSGSTPGRVLTKMLGVLSGAEVVHHYGRIGLTPANRKQQFVEMSLLGSPSAHQLYFKQGTAMNREAFPWPANLIDTIEGLKTDLDSYCRRNG